MHMMSYAPLTHHVHSAATAAAAAASSFHSVRLSLSRTQGSICGSINSATASKKGRQINLKKPTCMCKCAASKMCRKKQVRWCDAMRCSSVRCGAVQRCSLVQCGAVRCGGVWRVVWVGWCGVVCVCVCCGLVWCGEVRCVVWRVVW